MPPLNAPYRRPYSAPIAPSSAPMASPVAGNGFLGNILGSPDTSGASGAFFSSFLGDSPMAAGLQQAAKLQQINALKQQTAQYLLGKGLADNPEEAMTLAGNPQLVSLLQKDNSIASQFEQRKAIAEQAGIKPGDPAYQPFVTTGQWRDTGSTGRVIPVGNGQLYNQDTGKFITAPGVGGVDQSSLDPNNAPILEPGQRDEQFLKTLDPNTAAVIKGIVNYDIPLDKVSSMRGNQRQQMAALARRYDPTFDMQQYGARKKTRDSFTSGPYSQVKGSANLVIQHLDALVENSKQLGTTSYPLLNSGINLWNTETGQTAIKKFNADADAVASELAKVFKGTGVSSEEEVKQWRANISPNDSPEQIRASAQEVITKLLASRLDTLNNIYKAGVGAPKDFTILTPHSKQVLAKLGIDADAVEQGTSGSDTVPPPDAGSLPTPQTQQEFDALPAGSHYIDPDDGKEYVK